MAAMHLWPIGLHVECTGILETARPGYEEKDVPWSRFSLPETA